LRLSVFVGSNVGATGRSPHTNQTAEAEVPLTGWFYVAIYVATWEMTDGQICQCERPEKSDNSPDS